MSRFWVAMGLLMLSMLLLFFLMQALHLPFLEEDTAFWLRQEKWVAGLTGVALLVADVVAPVPSSIIMWVNGVLFGLALGSLLSVVGGLGAALAGHWIGAKGERVARRWIGEGAILRAKAFFERYGVLAVIVSRPIPILAEAVSIVAGMAGLPRTKLLWSATIGLVPAAALYAFAGAYSVDLNSGLYTFLAVFLISTVVFLIGKSTMSPTKKSAI